MSDRRPLRIVHCFRSPVGGIFRHVRDLVAAQKAAGHQVGILCDSSTGGEFEERLFEAVAPDLALGLIRIPMRRAITPGDLLAVVRTLREIRHLRPDVLHAHGAKGGAYARIVGTLLRISGTRVARLYCPHGGSIHYDAATWQGRLYFAFERLLERMTDRLIFVSRYEADGYAAKVGHPRCPVTLVANGLRPEELRPVTPGADAADFLYIGMMRDLKGPDLFLRALALMRDRHGRTASARFVGDGPDKARYEGMIAQLRLDGQVTVHPAMPARRAFAMARMLVVPSRAESMPYIVLEAIGAGLPTIATRVGGIPEIFAAEASRLVEPDNAEALAAAMLAALDDPAGAAARARAMHGDIAARFTVAGMAAGIEAAYRACLP
ncbi:MAG: transferase [Alphaproteobacteria bacterium]|nr:MAG: transferase [Alphaproteobacteria bacterium]